jgi:hypothetical protein
LSAKELRQVEGQRRNYRRLSREEPGQVEERAEVEKRRVSKRMVSPNSYPHSKKVLNPTSEKSKVFNPKILVKALTSVEVTPKQESKC